MKSRFSTEPIILALYLLLEVTYKGGNSLIDKELRDHTEPRQNQRHEKHEMDG